MEKKYINLKEAAALSGYAPDYIGQLIRGGKIEGKQIYSNIAWVTTEEAVLEYLKKKESQKNGGNSENRPIEKLKEFKNRISMELQFTRLVRWVLYGTIGFCAVLMLALFYVFSVNFDKKLQERVLEKVSPAVDVLPSDEKRSEENYF